MQNGLLVSKVLYEAYVEREQGMDTEDATFRICTESSQTEQVGVFATKRVLTKAACPSFGVTDGIQHLKIVRQAVGLWHFDNVEQDVVCLR